MHHLSICSKCGYGHSSATCVTDDEVVAWFDSQAEEFLAALPGYEDGLTPRSAWNTFFSSSPATETAPASSPAPVVAGQGEGTPTLEEFQRWLETAAHDALRAYENPPSDLSGQDLRLHLEGSGFALLDCRVATQLLMAFKLERGK